MRFSPKVLGLMGLSFIPSVYSNPFAACPFPGNQLQYQGWYFSMLYTAQNYIAAENTLPIGDAELKAFKPINGNSDGLDDLSVAYSGNCAEVVLNFVESVRQRLLLQETLGTNCPTTTWDNVEHRDRWLDYKCIRLILAATEDFNAGASNGYDIVTGAPNNRCAVSEYTNLEALFMPYPGIVAVAYEDATADPPQKLMDTYASRVAQVTDIIGPDFSDNLKMLPVSSVGGTCRRCFDDFYEDVHTEFVNNPASAAACSSKYLVPKTACKDALAAVNNKFHNCIGGLYVHYQHPIPQCTTPEWEMFDNVFRAYGAVAGCSSLTGQDFLGCVTDISGLPLGTSSAGCLQCWNLLGAGTRGSSSAGACQLNPFSSDCTGGIDGTSMTLATLADNGMNSPLTEFQVCSGRAINTVDTKCSADEIAAIASLRMNMVDLMGIAMNAGSEEDAVAAARSQLPEIAMISNCGSSFKALIAQMSRHSTILSQTCVDEVPSDACIEDLTNLGIVKTFNTGSGLDLVALLIAPTTPEPEETTTEAETTTEEETTTVETSGVSETVVTMSIALAISSLVIRI